MLSDEELGDLLARNDSGDVFYAGYAELIAQAREANMLRAKCADIEAHHISNLADQVRVLKAEVERLRQKAGLAEETQAIMADLLAVSRKNANVDEHDQMVEDAAEELLRRYEEANRDV